MKIDFTDGCIYSGLASVGAGVWMIYPPAALIVVGVLVLGLGLAAIVVRNRNPKPKAE